MGRSHAVRLAEAGADIIAVDICRQIESVAAKLATPEDLARDGRGWSRQTGRRVVARASPTSVTGPSCGAAVSAGVAELGRLDIVVANAGHVRGPRRPADRRCRARRDLERHARCQPDRRLEHGRDRHPVPHRRRPRRVDRRHLVDLGVTDRRQRRRRDDGLLRVEVGRHGTDEDDGRRLSASTASASTPCIRRGSTHR